MFLAGLRLKRGHCVNFGDFIDAKVFLYYFFKLSHINNHHLNRQNGVRTFQNFGISGDFRVIKSKNLNNI